MNKARQRAKKSNLYIESEIYTAKQRTLECTNRKRRRNFEPRTVLVLKQDDNSTLSKSLKKDRKGREDLKMSQMVEGRILNPANFTHFLAN